MMDRIKPLFKTILLGLASLIAVLGLIMLPLMTCGKTAKADGTDSYLLLEYIEADGAQYIDTGFVPNANTRWSVDIAPVMDGSWHPMGAYTDLGGSNSYFRITFYNDTAGVGVGYGASQKNISNSFGVSRCTVILDGKNLYGSANSTSTTLTSGTVSVPSLYIFAQHVGNSTSGTVSGKLYSSQIYNNGSLARNFVPAKRSSDGEVGLLDTINGVFYTNQGSGSFTAGYLEHDYYICDFIQSSGTQYIDTEFVPSNTTDVIVTGKYLSTPTAQSYLAAAYDTTSGTTNRYYLGTWFSGGDILNMYGTSTTRVPGVTFNQAVTYTAELNPLLGFGAINNTSQTFTPAGGNYVTSIALFAQHSSADAYLSPVDARLRAFSAYNNGVMQRNMIPVYDPVNNIAGMLDNVNNVWYGNIGEGSFVYNITGSPTIYQVNSENALNSALSSSVAGDLIVMTSDITTSATTTAIGAAPVYFGSYSLNSSNHPNIVLYTVEGWYSTKWTSKASEKLLPNTTYYARFQANISSGQNFSLALGGPVDGDILNITSTFTHTYESFTVPAGVTIDLNGNNILPPEQTPMTQVGFNSDPTATTAATSFTAGNTYYAIYSRPSYSATLKVNSSATVDLTQLPAGATRGPSSTTGLDDITFTYTYGDSITFPNPVLTYYSFNGWYSNNQGPYSGINPTDYGVKVYEARWVTAPVIEIGNVKIFQKLSGTFSNDRLILFTYNITWGDYTPAYNVNTLFVFRLMDEAGTNTLMTTQVSTMGPNGGYEMGMGAFYFPDDSIIDWGEEYQIRIDGNPSMWYTISDLRAIYNITPANYTEASGHSDNQTAAGNEILSIYLNLEENWQGRYRLVTTTTDGDMVLTSGLGNQYTLDILPNALSLVPDIFANKSTEHNPSELPNDDNTGIKNEPPELIQRWENQYDGTWVQTSFQALGDLFHVSWRLVTSLMCVALWVILAAISQRRWGTTDAGMWAGAVVMGIGTTMGIMEWSIVGAATILLALYGLYIVFWRQG